MEYKILKVVTTLGVPGLALGIMYLLMKSFGFTFSAIDPVMSSAIAIVFLIIVAGITSYALHLWQPHRTLSVDEKKISIDSRDKFFDAYKNFYNELVFINDANPDDGTRAIQLAIDFFGDVAREFYIRNRKILHTDELETLLFVIEQAAHPEKLNNHSGKREFGINILEFCSVLHQRVLDVT